MTQPKKRLGLAIPESLYQKILDQARYQGKTINSTCLDIFWEYFEHKDEIKKLGGEQNELDY